jgi:hypothetical protein
VIGAWDEGGSVYTVKRVGMIDEGIVSESAKGLDLGFESAGAVFEADTESSVLEPVPTSPDAHSEVPPTQDRELRCLFGNERCLVLGEHEDARRKPDPLGDGSRIREQYDWFAKSIRFVVGALEFGCAIAVFSAKHVIVEKQVGVAEALCRLCIVTNNERVVSYFAGGKHHAELHRSPSEILVEKSEGTRERAWWSRETKVAPSLLCSVRQARASHEPGAGLFLPESDAELNPGVPEIPNPNNHWPR